MSKLFFVPLFHTWVDSSSLTSSLLFYMFSMLLNTCLLLLSPTLDSRCCCPRPVLSPIHTQQPPNDHLHSMCVPFKNSQCRTLAIFPSPCNALSLGFTAVNLDLPNNTQKPSQMTMTLRWSIIASSIEKLPNPPQHKPMRRWWSQYSTRDHRLVSGNTDHFPSSTVKMPSRRNDSLRHKTFQQQPHFS